MYVDKKIEARARMHTHTRVQYVSGFLVIINQVHIHTHTHRLGFVQTTRRTLSTQSTGDLLTRIPSQRETARSGRSARSVRIDRNAGMSAAPAQMAPRLISDNCTIEPIHTRTYGLYIYTCCICIWVV